MSRGLDIRDRTTFDGPDSPSDDDLSKCVHCGLCLNYCPTFRVTGLESESPRGRLYLMTQWKRGQMPFTADLARHIDLCLGCRTCEAVCPSGVPYGRIIEGGRAEVERLRPRSLKRWLVRQGLRSVLARPARLRAAIGMARLAQRLGVARALPGAGQLPVLRSPFKAPPENIAPPIGPRRYRVAFLTGCVMPLMYASAHEASVRLLQLAGCEVWFPPDQRCCGALHAHNGDLEGARQLREVNLKAFGDEPLDALIVNSAGCGAHLKDFYQELKFPVRDLFEFLDQVGLPEPTAEVPARVAYQDACHLLHAQAIGRQPRHLLSGVPGAQVVELQHPDICCGSAGLYATLETTMSDRILAEKMDDVIEAGPEIITTANPGCQMQLERGLRARGQNIKVMHLAEFVALAYPERAMGPTSA
ncbi:MAG: (Fe-S)-binding protein [Candidatus Dormibacteraceae bacterium]